MLSNSRSPAFSRVYAVGLILIRCTAQEAHNEAAVGQIVQQAKLFDNSDWIVQRQQVANMAILTFLHRSATAAAMTAGVPVTIRPE
jgi:hypothetical protein